MKDQTFIDIMGLETFWPMKSIFTEKLKLQFFIIIISVYIGLTNRR